MTGQAVITLRSKQWLVELATTPWELSQGLGGIPAIQPQTGMLFDTGMEQIIQVTTEPMLFALDIAFVSEQLIITEVYHNVPPGYLVTSEQPARFFLEVNAGELEGVEVGDVVSIDTLAVVVQSDWVSTMVSLFGFIVVAAFVVSIAKSFVKTSLGEPESLTLLPYQASTEKVYFIGSCKISEGMCLTHGYSISETVKCPQSPLTDEEWKAAFELVKTAFPEGQPNPWVNGWWPETLEEAERAVRRYETSLWDAFRKYEGRAREAIDRYRRSAEKAIHHYRMYVMREYERGKEEALLPQTEEGQEVFRHLDKKVAEAVAKERENEGAEVIEGWSTLYGQPIYKVVIKRPHSYLKESTTTPRLIGPTRREKEPPPEELEFFADSPDHIDHSMNRNGLRPQVEKAFQEAIARAKGAR